MSISTPRSSDWHETGTAAANTEVVVTRREREGASNYITSFGANYSATTTGEVDLYGLTKVGPLDLTSTAVLNLSTDVFTVSGHGLSDAQQVVYYALSGTTPTGLTSGNTYFVVNVSGDDFQLESSVGGGAINMSGTQANFTSEALILPLSKSWEIYDIFELVIPSPWEAPQDCPIIVKLEAVSGIVGKINMSGYAK